MRKIEVTIPRAGISTGASTVKVEADGFVGDTCKNATDAIESAVGSNRSYEEKAHMEAPQQDVEHLREG